MRESAGGPGDEESQFEICAEHECMRERAWGCSILCHAMSCYRREKTVNIGHPGGWLCSKHVSWRFALQKAALSVNWSGMNDAARKYIYLHLTCSCCAFQTQFGH
jgi:hypothetical protein